MNPNTHTPTMRTRAELETADFPQPGNWRKLHNFGWHGQPAAAEDFTLYHYVWRDSTILEQSNAGALQADLEPYESDGPADNPDVQWQHFRHWAVGWCDAVAVRCYGPDGQPTRAYLTLCDHVAALADYPVRDEEDFSRQEYESAIEAIEQNRPYELDDGREIDTDQLPADWASQAFGWLGDYDQRQLDNIDGHGAYPSSESIGAAIADLWPELIGPDPDAEPETTDTPTED